jgi:phosphatidylserine/phosphatidylglycerophosphate/cardiolipin synthase-like enzyme
MLRSRCLLLIAAILLTSAALAAEETGTLQFLESVPEESVLDLPDLDQAWEVWSQVLGNATESVAVASFYFSRQGDGKDAGSPPGVADRLAPLIDSLPGLGQRGVKVRVLGDGKFFKTYPEALTWLDGQKDVTARHIDAGGLWGGVMHAKYFVVDDRAFYVGSQNWDWRALTQIHELGALVRHPRLARQLRAVFDLDWELAARTPSGPVPEENPVWTVLWPDTSPAALTTAGGDTVLAVLAASPPQALPPGVPWDLPLMVEMIDGAQQRVRVQLLSYGVADREGRFFETLDNALRRAAARKVEVQIILSNWAKRRYSVPWIQSLAAVQGIEVKFSNIPEHSAGFIPFARVEHAKYLTVDGKGAWVGTSNWSRDYFYQSRNVSLLMHGAGAAGQLDTFFTQSWDGPYTETVDPCGQYQPPRRN